MAHEISLEQALEKSCLMETVLRMLESYPDHIDEAQLSSVVTLTRTLAGEVYCWLLEEQSQRGNK
ncbi:hypothetical protein ACP26F_09770 [Franconibacter pulveris 1160]|uniref:hypothetical protein n=1 Tax=Franconibacter pulveris TaxID=435910 RepID=UPI000464F245|nr:hypothetical protein [Franconibacter pulveris]